MGRLNDDGHAVVMAVTKPIQRHVGGLAEDLRAGNYVQRTSPHSRGRTIQTAVPRPSGGRGGVVPARSLMWM